MLTSTPAREAANADLLEGVHFTLRAAKDRRSTDKAPRLSRDILHWHRAAGLDLYKGTARERKLVSACSTPAPTPCLRRSSRLSFTAMRSTASLRCCTPKHCKRWTPPWPLRNCTKCDADTKALQEAWQFAKRADERSQEGIAMLLFRPEIQFLQAVTSVRSGHLLGPVCLGSRIGCSRLRLRFCIGLACLHDRSNLRSADSM